MTDDFISRQAAITILCKRRCGNKPKGCPSGFCTESLAVDCIPSAQPEQRWIPCSEQLPECGIDVLTVDGYGEYEINHIIDEEGEWYWEPPATAWMPLPEWKGGEGE